MVKCFSHSKAEIIKVRVTNPDAFYPHRMTSTGISSALIMYFLFYYLCGVS
jgi:hypothetical protein